MIAKLQKAFCTQIMQDSLEVNLILILSISIFLPFYITVPVIFAAFIFFISDKNRRIAIFNTPFAKLFAFLGLLVLVVPLVYKNYYGFGCGILLDIFFVLAFYISSVMTEKLFNLICGLWCAMSLISAAVAVIEKLSGLQTRVMALTYNANFYGYIIELTVLICFYKFAITKKPVFFLIVAANIGALALTDCRSAWSALLIGLVFFFCILKKKKSVIILSALAAAITIAICFDHSLFPRHNDMSSTVTNRVYIWSRAFNDFLQHPIFGRGLLAFYQVSHNSITPHAHNILIDLLECTGIVGTSILIFYFVSVIRQLTSSFRLGNQQIKTCVALCGGVIAATLTHGITDMPVMGIQTGLFFIFVLSLRPRLATAKQSDKVESVNYPELLQVKIHAQIINKIPPTSNVSIGHKEIN